VPSVPWGPIANPTTQHLHNVDLPLAVACAPTRAHTIHNTLDISPTFCIIASISNPSHRAKWFTSLSPRQFTALSLKGISPLCPPVAVPCHAHRTCGFPFPRQLQVLQLGWNNLGFRGGRAVAEGLQCNSTLTEVYLPWTGITDTGEGMAREGSGSQARVRAG